MYCFCWNCVLIHCTYCVNKRNPLYKWNAVGMTEVYRSYNIEHCNLNCYYKPRLIQLTVKLLSCSLATLSKRTCMSVYFILSSMCMHSSPSSLCHICFITTYADYQKYVKLLNTALFCHNYVQVY